MHMPNGYSHVVKAGDTIYIAGQVARTPDGSLVGKDDPTAQAEQVFKNLQAALASVGATLQDLVKTTTYVVSPDCIDAVRAARIKYLVNDPPTSTLLVVSRLALPEILLEIEAVAFVG
jgi:enamine deaminase RidA (YjgF/YER057c/UK114 family)